MSETDETVLQSRVPPTAAGQRLDEWLAARFRYQDLAQWRAEIAAGRLQRNGRVAAAGDRLQRDDLVAYRPVHREPAANLAIELLHDEPAFVVVAKPAHLVAHADGAFVQNTFFRVLERLFAARGEKPRLALAHRLDRETSGVLVVAKTKAASRALQLQFGAGRVAKEYLAVVQGVVEQDRLVLDGPIGRDPGSVISIRRAVVAADSADARAACTEIEVLERLRRHTLVRAIPRTGRTHQIRVHLAHAGHPVAGDKLYGQSDDGYLEFVRHVKAGGDAGWGGRLGPTRHLLHAGVLEIDHPEHGARLRFEAPVPDDLTGFVAGAR